MECTSYSNDFAGAGEINPLGHMPQQIIVSIKNHKQPMLNIYVSRTVKLVVSRRNPRRKSQQWRDRNCLLICLLHASVSRIDSPHTVSASRMQRIRWLESNQLWSTISTMSIERMRRLRRIEIARGEAAESKTLSTFRVCIRTAHTAEARLVGHRKEWRRKYF